MDETAVFGRHAAPAGTNLCQTCRNCVHISGHRESEEQNYCQALAKTTPIEFQVVTCTRYLPTNHPSMYEMEQIAWVLRTDPKTGRKIGFTPPMKEDHSYPAFD